MSSIQNKISKNEKKSKSVSIDDIIKLVEAFEYINDSKTVNDNNENNKSKNPKSKVQIQKKSLTKLLKTMIQIKNAVVDEQRTLKDKIYKLYESLKLKLGNDMYLLNVKLLVKFLQGYQSNKPGKLTTSVRLFFDALLSDVEKELNILLNESEFYLLANLFSDNRIEQNLSQIIKSALGKNTNDEEKDGKNRILSHIYIYIVLNNRSRNNFSYRLFTVEQLIAEQVLEFQLTDKSKYLHKVLPEALIDRNPKTKIRSSVYLYYSTKNKELTEEVQSLDNQLTKSQDTILRLTRDGTQLKAEVEQKENEIEKLKKEVEQKDNEISKLSDELTDTTRSLSYETNDLKRQLDVTKTGIVSNIKKQTKFALEDLAVIASRLPEDQGAELSDWIKHLKGIFDSLSEK